MAFTYTDTLLTNRDLLRFMIGDVFSTYEMFSDGELDAILADANDDTDEARGVCFSILAQDPDRLVSTKDGTAGGFTLLALMKLYAQRAAEYYSS